MRYRCRALNAFWNCASARYFQNQLEAALSGLEGVKAIVDDLLVLGEDETMEKAIEQHNARLLELLGRCREEGIEMQPEKFRFQAQEVQY